MCITAPTFRPRPSLAPIRCSISRAARSRTATRPKRRSNWRRNAAFRRSARKSSARPANACCKTVSCSIPIRRWTISSRPATAISPRWKGLIDVSQHKLTTLRAELDKLTRTAANLERGGKTVSGELRDDISNLQGQIERENSFIRSQRAQQNEVREKFAADVARYKQLRALQAKQ